MKTLLFETNPSGDCELCTEIHAKGSSLTNRFGYSDEFSRLIRRTHVADALAGAGSIRPGYVLVMPRKHVLSIGELCTDDLRHVLDLTQSICGMIRQRFDVQTVCVEHGSSMNARSGACISHAHIHIFPISSHRHALGRFRTPGADRVAGFAELQRAARQGLNYYACWSDSGETFVQRDPEMVSQFGRRQWADLLGAPEKWDWALFPFLENVEKTTKVMGQSNDPITDLTDDPVDPYQRNKATIEAYNLHADEYANLTEQFPAASTLPDELMKLAKLSSGPILDAGAGGGRDARFLAALGCEVLSLDAASKLLQTSKAGRNITQVVGDVRRLPIAGCSIGAVWSSAVLLHFDQAAASAAMSEFFRVLRPGGFGQVSVKAGTGDSKHLFDDGGAGARYFYYFEMPELVDLAVSAGFEVCERWEEHESDEADVMQLETTWVKVLLRRPC